MFTCSLSRTCRTSFYSLLVGGLILCLGKVIVPGTHDRLGRPIVIFRARLHDPQEPFLHTLRIILYQIEREFEYAGGTPAYHVYCLVLLAINSQACLGSFSRVCRVTHFILIENIDTEEIVIIHDLKNFSRKNADNRMVKFLVEMLTVCPPLH